MIKESGEWREIDWEEALNTAAQRLKEASGDKTGMLASPGTTVEEGHLLSRLAGHLGTANIDHRIERRDFSDEDNDPPFPWLGCDIADVEDYDAIFVIGSNLRQEAPIIAHRVRKAAVKGASVSFASSEEHEYFFDVDTYLSGAGLAELLSGDGIDMVVGKLKAADKALVLLGNIAGRHEAFSTVRALAAQIASTTNATLGSMSPGANSAGLSLAGVLPQSGKGKNVASMLDDTLDAVLMCGVEPGDLLAVDDAVGKLGEQSFVIALTAFDSEAMRDAADLLLPIGTFAETSGTFVNVAGTWQSFAGVANPVGQSRPAWKVLRVLGNLVEAEGFDYLTSEDVRDEMAAQLGDIEPAAYSGKTKPAKLNGEDDPGAEIDVPIYSVDGLVRRAAALQLTVAAKSEPGDES
jgi:NADH-quinone oxidoreductase subunit G